MVGISPKERKRKTKLYLNFENLVGVNEMVEYSSAGKDVVILLNYFNRSNKTQL